MNKIQKILKVLEKEEELQTILYKTEASNPSGNVVKSSQYRGVVTGLRMAMLIVKDVSKKELNGK